MSCGFSLTARSCLLSIALPLVTLFCHGLLRQYAGLHGLPLYASSGGIAVLVGLGAVWLLFGGVSKALQRATDHMRSAASGTFPAALPPCGIPGVADLHTALNAVCLNLKSCLGNFKGLTEAISIPYALVDTKGFLVACNANTLQFLERRGDPSEFVGMFFSEFFYNDRQRKALIVQIMDEDKPWTNEVEFKNFGGHTRKIIAALSPLHDLDGKVCGGLCMYHDLTELRAKEARLVAQSEQILDTVRSVEQILSSLTDTSQELSSQVESASRGAALQHQRSEETSRAMEQMNEAVLDVAKSAGSAADSADAAQSKAKDGAVVVESAVQAIHQVESHTNVLKQSMAELSDSAAAISRIMNVISDIADQTNLLALNAAIEAARAGDAGRGFAVVADEVRKLAEKTMLATKEVADATKAIMDGVKRSLDGTDLAAQAVTQATTLATRSGASLQEIVQLVVVSSDQVRTIAAAAEEQSTSSEQITQAVEDVRRVSTETAQEMENASRGVARLKELAGLLQATVHSLTT